MNKHTHYLGIDFKTEQSTKISNKGVKEVIDNLKEQLFDMAELHKRTKKTIIAKITIEYGTEEDWKKETQITSTLIKIQEEWEKELKENPKAKYEDILKKHFGVK